MEIFPSLLAAARLRLVGGGIRPARRPSQVPPLSVTGRPCEGPSDPASVPRSRLTLSAPGAPPIWGVRGVSGEPDLTGEAPAAPARVTAEY